jgi:Tfp pilus assembly protein PilV
MKSKFLPKAAQRRSASGEEGFVLVEVMVSAMIITIAAIGVFSALTAAEKSTAQERHRAQAHGLAQADIARLRTMRISQLSPSLSETTTKTVEGTPYTVLSDAQFINAKTGTDTCEEKEASADYIRIRSTITWPGMGSRPAVVETSLVAPPNSTAQAESGALIVQVQNGAEELVPGIPITGSGPTPFSRETGENGCAVFGNLRAGKYLVSATVPGMVNPEGEESGTVETSVVAQATKVLVLEYDTPGELIAKFVTRYEGEAKPATASTARGITIFNHLMAEPRAFKSTSGLPLAEVTAGKTETSGGLFPFDDGYSVYAGICGLNNPDPKSEHPSAAIVQATVTAGGKVVATIELPALHLRVWTGSSSGSPGVVASGAKVVLTDTDCAAAGKLSVDSENKQLKTNTEGKLNIGLPFSRNETGAPDGYTVCVSGIGSNGKQMKREVTKVSVPNSSTNIPGGAERTIYLRESGAVEGAECT